MTVKVRYYVDDKMFIDFDYELLRNALVYQLPDIIHKIASSVNDSDELIVALNQPVEGVDYSQFNKVFKVKGKVRE